jgi:predicted NACHT family NTPase
LTVIKKYVNKLREILCLWFRRFNVAKMLLCTVQCQSKFQEVFSRMANKNTKTKNNQIILIKNKKFGELALSDIHTKKVNVFKTLMTSNKSIIHTKRISRKTITLLFLLWYWSLNSGPTP